MGRVMRFVVTANKKEADEDELIGGSGAKRDQDEIFEFD
jgi:hypothetical protein